MKFCCELVQQYSIVQASDDLYQIGRFKYLSLCRQIICILASVNRSHSLRDLRRCKASTARDVYLPQYPFFFRFDLHRSEQMSSSGLPDRNKRPANDLPETTRMSGLPDGSQQSVAGASARAGSESFVSPLTPSITLGSQVGGPNPSSATSRL